jgi:NTE family protein
MAVKIALVIGAGAVKCASALGAWKVLEQAQIPVDLYVGCSGGSLYASEMALGFSLEECVDKTRRLWNRKVTEKQHWPSLLRAALPGIFGFNERFAMIDDRPLLASLRGAFGQATFAQARTPLYIVAADFHNAEQVVLSQGSLVDAVRASISIPYIWQPWQVGERLLVDGSLVNPLPIDVAIREGAEVILALGFDSAYPRRIKSLSRFAFHINSLMTNNLYHANFAFHNLAHHAEIIPILPDFEGEIGLFDTQKFPQVIAAGERAMQDQLPYIRKLLDRIADVEFPG